MAKIRDYSLYLVVSQDCGLGRKALEIARLAIKGEVDIIQMREKNKSRPELIKLGGRLSRLCKEKGITFIVNDDPLIAKKARASGVHLGQEDLQKYPIPKTRKIIGKGKIIGVSTHSLTEVKKANKSDADYIAYGPVFPTKTKNYFLGTKDIKKVLKTAIKPVFFIGGITLENLDKILKLGAKNIALIRGITEARDITAGVRIFKHRLIKARDESIGGG